MSSPITIEYGGCVARVEGETVTWEPESEWAARQVRTAHARQALEAAGIRLEALLPRPPAARTGKPTQQALLDLGESAKEAAHG